MEVLWVILEEEIWEGSEVRIRRAAMMAWCQLETTAGKFDSNPSVRCFV